MILTIILTALLLISVAYNGRLYLELYRWARQCKHARIAVSFKNKVVLQAPILEWILWCNQLDKDPHSNGRVVYRNAHTAVAIAKAVIPKNRVQLTWHAWTHRHDAPQDAPVKEAKYTATDLTDSAELRRQRRAVQEPRKNYATAAEKGVTRVPVVETELEG